MGIMGVFQERHRQQPLTGFQATDGVGEVGKGSGIPSAPERAIPPSTPPVLLLGDPIARASHRRR